MQYPQLPVAAFVAAFLVLIPVPWHWRARNVATCAIISWLFVINIIYGINSIIWAADVIDRYPIWCDICTKIIVGASFALPICTMCVCKHLEMVSSNRKVQYDYNDKRRRIIFESVMCFGLPMIFMALHYIVQGHRYDVFQYIGCQATVFISIPAVMIIWVPPLFFSLMTLVYASLALHHFIRRRITFAAHLQNSNSALTPNRYLRLIAMAITEIVWGTVLTSLNLWNNIMGGLRPWTTWEDVHFNFSRVALFPAVLLPPRFISTMMLLWAAMPVSAIIFFIFFGFGEEAKKEYSKLWAWIRVKVFRRRDTGKKGPLPGIAPNSFPKPLRLSTFGLSSTSSPTSTTQNSSDNTDVEKGLPPLYTASTNSSFPHTPIKRDPDSFSISTLPYYGAAVEAARPRVGLPSTPRPIFSNPIAGSSTSSLAASSLRPTPSVESLPPRIELSPLHDYSPSTSCESLVDFNTAPPSFLTNKTSNFTLRSTQSVDRIYLVSQNSRPQRVRTPTPAPFRDLQDIPSEDDRSFYSGTSSAASSRRPSVTGEEDTSPPLPSTQPRLPDAIWVTVHTETRHGA
ncbi:hypothetical protein ONZ45_g7334 [Pleurotus djamor]|nr:hypothetical protein ONZ45_g7334 [Pleurotus djamor]